MNPKRGHNLPQGTVSKSTLGAIQQLSKLLVGFCVVFSLMVMQFQSCSFADAGESAFGVICTDDGFAFIDSSADDQKQDKTCNRCPDCLTCSGSALGLPLHAAHFEAWVFADLGTKGLLASLYVGSPDHLLPFSGAPPPEKLDQTMLTTYFETVRFASSKSSIMPEFVSWH